MTRSEALTHAATLAAAVDVPVSADLENCFSDDPAGVAATVTDAVAGGDHCPLAGVRGSSR